MPKMIPELRAQFIAAARQRLLYTKDHDLTIRQIADDCQTGIGTVYNYFSSKDALIASVMQEDWDRMKQRTYGRMQQMEDSMDCIRTVYQELQAFLLLYSPIWEYVSEMDRAGLTGRYHPAAIRELSEMTRFIIERHDLHVEPYTDVVLAEIMFNMAIRSGEQFQAIDPIIKRILGIPYGKEAEN